LYRVRAVVEEVRGKCPIYKPGDSIVFERFYISSRESSRVCMHALSAMLTLLSAFIKGVSAVDLGIGEQPDVGWVQCPDPGPPRTCGGTVVFKLVREPIP